MAVSKNEGYDVDIVLSRGEMEQAVYFRHLSADVHEIHDEIIQRIRQEEKVGGALRTVWKGKWMSVKAKKECIKQL